MAHSAKGSYGYQETVFEDKSAEEFMILSNLSNRHQVY